MPKRVAELPVELTPKLLGQRMALLGSGIERLAPKRGRVLGGDLEHRGGAADRAGREDPSLGKLACDVNRGFADLHLGRHHAVARQRNPTDLQLRFELGEHFVNAQRFREAVPELQRARQNPNARLKAMNLLGICYRELGMLDLAMKQFEDAAKEILTMDAMKKEIVYNLGIVYEKMGAREKSLDCMKQIYEADYGFKDVAERVESSYK